MGTMITILVIGGACIIAFLLTRMAKRNVDEEYSGNKKGLFAVEDPSRYLAVAFDLDGTLLNTAGDLTEAVNYTRRSKGLEDLSKEDVIPKLGSGVNNLLRCTLPGDMTEEEFSEARKVFSGKYNEICEKSTYAYEGIKPLLEGLKNADYKLAVITNKDNDTAGRLIRSFFPGVFDVVRGRVGELRKPDPKIMEDALVDLGVSADRMLYVGDSEVDRQFGANAGVETVLVSWGFRDRASIEELVPEDHIIDKPRELCGFL